jgi:hypothetical protein
MSCSYRRRCSSSSDDDIEIKGNAGCKGNTGCKGNAGLKKDIEFKKDITLLTELNLKLTERVDKLEKLINDMILYQPDGEGYQEAKTHFETISK